MGRASSGWNVRRGAAPRAADARRAWDGSADVWEDFVEGGKDWSRTYVHGAAFLAMVGTVRGSSVLDVGCGQGYFTRILARRGARMVGVDWSSRMIESAQRHEAREPLGIEYRLLDARQIGRVWKRPRFDRVVASMSLMDMPDLDRVLRGIHRALRPGGHLVFSASHPVNTAAVRWERPHPPHGGLVIDRYFDERPGRTAWRMPRLTRPFTTPFWHRTLETWFMSLRRAGFEIEQLREPRPGGRALRAAPSLESNLHAPLYLVWDCRRARRGA